MEELFKEVLEYIDISNPEFEKAVNVSDWRNYVPREIQIQWNNLTEREKKLIIVIAQEGASAEDWD